MMRSLSGTSLIIYKLFFNNLGSWRSGVFNQDQYHDQVRYSFLMPVFVVGSWNVIPPQEILPEWDPPEPYIKKISLKKLPAVLEDGRCGKVDKHCHGSRHHHHGFAAGFSHLRSAVKSVFFQYR